MKNVKYFALAILFAVLAVPPVFAGYSLDKSSTTDGDSLWQDDVGPVLKMTASVNGAEVTFTVSKPDGGCFTSSGNMTLRSETHEGTILDGVQIYADIMCSRDIVHYVGNYSSSSFPKDFYFNYETPEGGWAWVGPIVVSYEPDENENLTSLQLTLSPSKLTVPAIYNGGNPDITLSATGSNCNFSLTQREKWMMIEGSSCNGRVFFTKGGVSDGTYQGEVEVCDDSACDTQKFTVIVGLADELVADKEPIVEEEQLSTADSSENCFIELPRYLCLNYRAEYSSGGKTKSTPSGSKYFPDDYYFPVEGGATVKHTFKLYNSTELNGASDHKLSLAFQPDSVSVVSQPTFSVPYKKSEYAYIEYTAPMVLGRHRITIHILNENGERVSSEIGLTSRIEVTSLPIEDDVDIPSKEDPSQLPELPPDGKCGIRSSN